MEDILNHISNAHTTYQLQSRFWSLKGNKARHQSKSTRSLSTQFSFMVVRLGLCRQVTYANWRYSSITAYATSSVSAGNSLSQQYNLHSLQDPLPWKIYLPDAIICSATSFVNTQVFNPAQPSGWKKTLWWWAQNFAQDSEVGCWTDSGAHRWNFKSLRSPCLVGQCLGHGEFVGKSRSNRSRANSATMIIWK